MIEGAGYKSMREFMEDYNRFSEEVSRYQEEVGDWERECREIEKRYEQGQVLERAGNIESYVVERGLAREAP